MNDNQMGHYYTYTNKKNYRDPLLFIISCVHILRTFVRSRNRDSQ
jgi:hypothetical protein